jgi:VanZ family protein
VLLHSWPKVFDRFIFADAVINIVLYMPIGMLAFLAVRRQGRRWLSVAGPLGLGLGLMLSVCMETLQLFVKGRVASALDVVCNVGGAAAGAGLGRLFQAILRRSLRQVAGTHLFRPSGGLFLICGWVAYQTLPFMPAISRTQLKLKVGHLLPVPPVSALDAFVICAELESIAGVRWTRRAMAMMWLLVPAKLLIEERTFTWAEFAGAALACAAWILFLYRHDGRIRLTAGALAVALVLNGLAPFYFRSVPAGFSWIPFSGFLESQALPGMLIFLRKCFWYGSAIWLLREAGIRIMVASGATAVVLAGLEAVQVYLPGRSAEITDPLLALLLGLCLWLADRHKSGPLRVPVSVAGEKNPPK